MNKVFTKLQGGLGNQLFQLSAGMLLRQKHDLELIAITGRYYGRDSREYELKNLEKLLKFRSVQFRNPFMRIEIRKEEQEFEFQEFGQLIGRNIELNGYFQHPNYVKNSVNQILQALNVMTENSYLEPRCLCGRMHTGIHIRRGDYLLPENKNTFGVLSDDYFGSIIEESPDSHIYVFTDGSLTDNFKSENIQIMGKEYSAWQTLKMMMNMDTLAISNSSLSWWAATLGMKRNPEMVVKSPSNWFREIPESNNLISNLWRRRPEMWTK
jgi:hypothetical protein